jgi:hypothetical protein
MIILIMNDLSILMQIDEWDDDLGYALNVCETPLEIVALNLAIKEANQKQIKL